VFVSSHLMSELEGIADDLVVIGRGRLIAQASVGELLASTLDGRVHVRTPQTSEVMTLLAEAGATVTSTGPESLTVSGLDVESIADLAAARRLLLHELYQERPSLEDAYFALTRESVEYSTADGAEAGS